MKMRLYEISYFQGTIYTLMLYMCVCVCVRARARALCHPYHPLSPILPLFITAFQSRQRFPGT